MIEFDSPKKKYRIHSKMHKEMVLAHSSYARAAGIQSEINKVTVTRVAGSEVEYKRLMNLYRKDMMMTINDIRREQKRLRKSVVRYSKRIRQGRMDRHRREKEHVENEKKAMEDMAKISETFLMTDSPIHNKSNHKELNGVSPDSGIDVTQEEEDVNQSEQVNGCTSEHPKKSNEEDSKQETCNKVNEINNNKSSLSHPLPSIMEATETEEMEDTGSSASENKMPRQSNTSSAVKMETEQNSQNSELEVKLRLHLKASKPKRQVVSFSDIIKLQHSTNTKKLFNLVELLAQKHGLKEKIEEKESRNSSILRGSTEESVSLRAASVLYPMKYGYDSEVSELTLPPIDSERQSNAYLTQDEISDNSDKSRDSRSSPGDGLSPNQYSFKSERTKSPLRPPEKIGTPSPKKTKKRNKSLPMLADEFQRMKLEQSQRLINSEDSRRLSMIGQPTARPKLLPPLPKQATEANVYKPRSNSISWAEAFGLLKGVHALQDQSG